MEWKDKVAVVTGAGGTLCSVIAEMLAAKGCKVVLIGRTVEKLEKTAQAIKAAGGVCRIEAGDVTDEARMKEIGDTVCKEWGPCRFLINGAGGNNIKAMSTITEFDPRELDGTLPEGERGFMDIDIEAFASVLNINTVGTVIPSRIFGAQMAKAGGGSILNFASMNTYRPLTRVAAYAMSKAAILNFTQWLSNYYSTANIRVNAVAPGFFVNERSVKYLRTPDGGLSQRGKNVMQHTPMKRFGEAQELLGCVEWLLDDDKAAFVTGITVPVDGGFLASTGV
ncbi:MAG: SDR family NAD(P)-dependent oxidoreductase [Victivallales bacterium]|nr:SDR family NAD(P)-dependent oxidoreductase [Victivallales bacterium]